MCRFKIKRNRLISNEKDSNENDVEKFNISFRFYAILWSKFFENSPV